MKAIIHCIKKEAIIILVVTLAISFIFNFARKGGIPLFAGSEAFRVKTSAEFISIKDAHALFEEGRAIFVDASEPAVFAAGHIEGAINAPASGEDVEDLAWLAGAGTDVICYSSKQPQRQAGVVADRLIGIGLAGEGVFVLEGAFEAWDRRGLPTRTGGE